MCQSPLSILFSLLIARYPLSTLPSQLVLRSPLSTLNFPLSTNRVFPVSNSCIMPCLRERVLSRRCSNAASSASMSDSTSAMAVCSSTSTGTDTLRLNAPSGLILWWLPVVPVAASSICSQNKGDEQRTKRNLRDVPSLGVRTKNSVDAIASGGMSSGAHTRGIRGFNLETRTAP